MVAILRYLGSLLIIIILIAIISDWLSIPWRSWFKKSPQFRPSHPRKKHLAAVATTIKSANKKSLPKISLHFSPHSSKVAQLESALHQNWSDLLTTKQISNSEYLALLQQWDRHLSMVADRDQIATQARQHFSPIQKEDFLHDSFPGLRFLVYEMTQSYAWYSHHDGHSPRELASLATTLKLIIQLYDRASILLRGDIGERRVYQMLQETYPHAELLDSLNLPFSYQRQNIGKTVNQIDIVLIDRNGIWIPEVKNYHSSALQLTGNGEFIVAYHNGYCEQISQAVRQLYHHEHAVSRILTNDATARGILKSANPTIHSMFISANPKQAVMVAPTMTDRLYNLKQLTQLPSRKAQRPLTGLEQRYLKELLANSSVAERQYEEPMIINLAKLDRQLLTTTAINEQHQNDHSPVTRFISNDILTILHRADFIDDHCRMR